MTSILYYLIILAFCEYYVLALCLIRSKFVNTLSLVLHLLLQLQYLYAKRLPETRTLENIWYVCFSVTMYK